MNNLSAATPQVGDIGEALKRRLAKSQERLDMQKDQNPSVQIDKIEKLADKQV